MSVLLNTSAGDLVIDLFTDSCPIATKNFVKLCQVKFYNNCLFYNVQQNFIAQTGDPTGTGKGGNSIYGILNGDAGYFKDEVVKGRKVNKVGMVGMAHAGGKDDTNRSQFFITLRGEDMEQFENSHTIFGEIAEGLDVLEKINALYCDEEGRPYQDVRILHTYVLDDPFPDPPGMVVPPSSPERTYPEQERVKRRLAYSETIEDDADGKTAEELDLSIRRKEAKSRAIVLEMTGDIPDADVKPPEEVLFVCKLNPVTTDEDLELIFSRFGTIKSCEVIRDFKTGDSLNYAFIEFETTAACIEAYEKMNNVLIDDRRIKVDFSQSVSKLWNRFLLQPRKGGPPGGDKNAPKPGDKPSYYMRQPGMDFNNNAPKVAPSTAASKPAPQQHQQRGGGALKETKYKGHRDAENFMGSAASVRDAGDRGRTDGGREGSRRDRSPVAADTSASSRRGRDDDRSGRDRSRDRARERSRERSRDRSSRDRRDRDPPRSDHHSRSDRHDRDRHDKDRERGRDRDDPRDSGGRRRDRKDDSRDRDGRDSSSRPSKRARESPSPPRERSKNTHRA